MKANLQTLYDENGSPIFYHTAGEVVTLFRCTPTTVQIRSNEKRCCTELPIWSGVNLTTPSFMQPTSRRISSTCTPRVCNHFEVPIFNVGSKDNPNWTKINKFGMVTKAEPPRNFIPRSENKNDQIVIGKSSIFITEQKEEFQKLSHIKDARELITSEMIYQTFPPASLNTSTTIESSSFSAQDFINGQLQQVFLPFPLSLLHLLPRWMLITGINIIVTLLTKIFLDPALAICNLCRASSMSIVDKITTVLVPTVSIFRRHQKTAAIEQGEEYPLKKLTRKLN